MNEQDRRQTMNRYAVLLASRRHGSVVFRDVSGWPQYSNMGLAKFLAYLEERKPTERVVVIDWGEASRKEDV